jgi:hypothetical protein
MKTEKNVSRSSNLVDCMNVQEVCNWMALCNALKFINHTCAITGKHVNEKDINYREMNNYISSVSGDMITCLREANGIPYKYSLSRRSEESLELSDISYEFLENKKN